VEYHPVVSNKGQKMQKSRFYSENGLALVL